MNKRAILFWFLLSAWTAASAVADGYLIFRYDDMAADAPGTRSLDPERSRLWQLEQRMDALFAAYDMKYVAAVIPRYISDKTTADGVCFYEDQEKTTFLQQAVRSGRAEVAQHGYRHLNLVHQRFPTHRHGEFRRRTLTEQLADIRAGKQILLQSGFEPVTFVPPWHGWDQKTITALKECHFQILSARRFYCCRKLQNLKIIPRTTNLNTFLTKLENASVTAEGLYVVILHPADVMEDGFLARLERILTKSSQIGLKGATFSQAAVEIGDQLGPDRFGASVALTKIRDFWKGALPLRILPGEQSRTSYLKTAQAKHQMRTWYGITAAILATVFAAGVAAKALFGRIFGRRILMITAILAAIITVAAAATEWNIVFKGYHIKSLPVLAIAACAGYLSWPISRFRNISKTPEVKTRPLYPQHDKTPPAEGTQR